MPLFHSWSSIPLIAALSALAIVQQSSPSNTLAQGEQPGESRAAAQPAASSAWRKLATERYPGKQDDIFFLDGATGWYVNGAGKIFKTTDGGERWVEKLHKPGTYFRCITFLDAQNGFAGNIGPGYFPNVSDATPLYRTADGGESWSAVESIEGAPVVGLCALEVVREPFINAGVLDSRARVVAVGRVGGPAVFLWSDDLGATWKQRSLSDSAAMAFDVHFLDWKRGFIAAGTDANVALSNALILATEDGGETWKPMYRSTRPFELTWKISFPTRETGYVTVQSYDPDPSASKRFVAKTTDGGKSWSELPLVDDAKVRAFGVGFVDERRGWVGAMPGGFETDDGGASWKRVEMGAAVNKVRIVRTPDGRTLGFAIGVEVHRLELPAASAK